MKALYSLLVGVALLVGCGGGDESGPVGSYAMTMKMFGKEMQIRFELKPDNTFTAITHRDRKKRG